MGVEDFEDKVAALLESEHGIDKTRVGAALRDCGDQVFCAYLKGREPEAVAKALAALLERTG
jgi:hypothetical protein